MTILCMRHVSTSSPRQTLDHPARHVPPYWTPESAVRSLCTGRIHKRRIMEPDGLRSTPDTRIGRPVSGIYRAGGWPIRRLNPVTDRQHRPL